jgi:glucose-6-phosphate isomerase
MKPFTTQLDASTGVLEGAENHLQRTLSSMKGQYLDQDAYQRMLQIEDTLLYEVYEVKLTEAPGELWHGTSIVHPGKVGDEYFMTKGHFHMVLDTAEVYYCLYGYGYMMMETPHSEWAAEELSPGVILYVPPYWAHRSINVGEDDLITYFVYPGNAGHDYRSIDKRGFRKLIVENSGKPEIVDNPRWLPPDER